MFQTDTICLLLIEVKYSETLVLVTTTQLKQCIFRSDDTKINDLDLYGCRVFAAFGHTWVKVKNQALVGGLKVTWY